MGSASRAKNEIPNCCWHMKLRPLNYFLDIALKGADGDSRDKRSETKGAKRFSTPSLPEVIVHRPQLRSKERSLDSLRREREAAMGELKDLKKRDKQTPQAKGGDTFHRGKGLYRRCYQRLCDQRQHDPFITYSNAALKKILLREQQKRANRERQKTSKNIRHAGSTAISAHPVCGKRRLIESVSYSRRNFYNTITAHSGLNIRTDEDIEGIDHFGVDPVVKDENEMNKHLNKEDKNTYKENIKAKHVRKEHMGGEIKKDDHGIISKSSRICCDHMMKKSRRAQFVAKRHYAARVIQGTWHVFQRHREGVKQRHAATRIQAAWRRYKRILLFFERVQVARDRLSLHFPKWLFYAGEKGKCEIPPMHEKRIP